MSAFTLQALMAEADMQRAKPLLRSNPVQVTNFQALMAMPKGAL